MDYHLHDALNSAYQLGRSGSAMNGNLRELPGVRAAMDGGLLAFTRDETFAGNGFIELTDAGRATLEEAGHGLPLVMRDFLFSKAPAAKVRRDAFEMNDPGHVAELLQTLQELPFYTIRLIRFADYDRPAVLATLGDSQLNRQLKLFFPAGTSREEMKAHPGVEALRQYVFALDRKKPDRERVIEEPSEGTRKLDAYTTDTSPAKLQEEAEEDARERHRSLIFSWNNYLGGDTYSTNLRNDFLEALDSPEIHVFRDQCEDDPQEICLRATGRTSAGHYWSKMNIMPLAPWWAKEAAEHSELLVETIVTHWDELREIRRSMLAEAAAGAESGQAVDEVEDEAEADSPSP